jgi:transcriptional repressor NrdR
LKRFTTYEYVELRPLMVVKRDGARECFDKNKLIEGILKACNKRTVSAERIENMADTVEQMLQNNFEKEVSSQIIGEMVMEQLCKIDEVAYIRFASVYRRFKDVDAFIDELKDFLAKKIEA